MSEYADKDEDMDSLELAPTGESPALSFRHERFCQEVVLGRSFAEAARRAGYEPAHAKDRGYKLARRYPPTMQRIAELKKQIFMGVEELMGRMAIIGRNQATDFISQDPKTQMLVFDFQAMKDRGFGFLLKGFSQNSRTGDVHYEFHDPMLALSRLGAANGALTEKKLVEVEAGAKLSKVIAAMQEAIVTVNDENAKKERDS